MFGFVARLIGGAVAPLVDQVTAFGASILRKLALFLVAGVCLVVVIIALTFAFDFWIASVAGPIVGALAVAALYLFIAAVSVILALRGGRRVADPSHGSKPETVADGQTKDETVDQFTAPILAMLASLGLRREQIAVLAGASLAKRLGPVPLVGIAIVAGFLVGRMWQGWDALVSNDLVDSVLDLVVPGRRSSETEARDEAA